MTSIQTIKLNDKYKIIDSFNDDISNETINITIINYIENFLISDIKLYIPDYIHQLLWFNNINHNNLANEISIIIQRFISDRIKSIRQFIKKDNYSLEALNKFMKSILDKFNYIDYLINNNNTIYKQNIDKIDLIIFDAIIYKFIESKLIEMNKDDYKEINKLFILLSEFGKYDDMQIFKKLINGLSNLFTKTLINITEYPFPPNIKNINNLKLSINYLKSINNYYKFIINNLNNENLYIHICNLLLKVIKTNSINDIELIFDNLWNEIGYLIFVKEFKEKNKYLTKISNELVTVISEEYKNESNYKIINILRYIFSNNTNLFIEGEITQLFKNDKILSNFISSISESIKTQNKKILKIIVNIIFKIQNKEIIEFIVIRYHDDFMKRLINYLNIKDSNTVIKYIAYEKFFIESTKIIFGKKHIYKLNKIIDDIEMCINTEMNDLLKVLTIHYDIWDIDVSNSMISNQLLKTIPKSNLVSYLTNYTNTYYDDVENIKSYNWFLHYGEIDITFMDKNILLLPIQYIILELFWYENTLLTYKYNEIYNHKILSNYSDKMKTNIINSLINSKLLIEKEDNISLTTNNDFSTNPIQIYFSNNDNKINNNFQLTLTFSLDEIIYCNINKILKSNPMNYDELLNICSKNIKLFKIDKNDFDKAIEYLIKYDYITIKDELYAKILY